MANSNNTIPSSQSGSGSTIPVPVLSLGCNYILQHQRSFNLSTFMAGFSTSSGYFPGGGVTLVNSDWANDVLHVGISFKEGNWDTFLASSPMVFMEIYTAGKRSSHKGRDFRAKWIHPPHIYGPLNRSTSNYGEGSVSTLFTEWDFFITKPNQVEIIDINQQGFYIDNGITLPIRWTDFVTTKGYDLKYLQRSPYVNNGNTNVVHFSQPIRFRFAMIDADGRSVILGEPSDILYIQPKLGYFKGEDDSFFYDWDIRFGKV